MAKQLVTVKTRKRTALAVPRSSKPSYNKIITEKESTPEEESKLSAILNAQDPALSHALDNENISEEESKLSAILNAKPALKNQDEDDDDDQDEDDDEDEDEDEDDDEDDDDEDEEDEEDDEEE